jgi:hypothetical protein
LLFFSQSIADYEVADFFFAEVQLALLASAAVRTLAADPAAGTLGLVLVKRALSMGNQGTEGLDDHEVAPPPNARV